MPNPYFQFKQFVIYQEQCAMKVSTDSCLFGAWISKAIVPRLSNVNRVLDIGAGTGLLMLMMAQEHACTIDGIEIDAAAYQQAHANIALTQWKERMQLYQADVKTFAFNCSYDLIISNPPFYENDLLPDSGTKAAAMHDATLRLDELLVSIEKCLAPKGYVALLIPFHRFNYLKTIFQSKGFYLQQAVHVRHSADRSAIRSMVLLSSIYSETTLQAITIKDDSGEYSAGFKELLNGYYL